MRRFNVVGKWLLAAAVGLSGFSMMPRAFAHDESSEISREGMKTVVGRVQRIDRHDRSVTLLDDKGRTTDLLIAKDSPYLSQLKIGDRVTASFYRETVLGFGQFHKIEREPVAGHMGRTVSVHGRITTLDADRGRLSIVANGKTHVFDVTDPTLQANLRQLRAGERINVTFTEAYATAIMPMPF